jgi:hypothetical protein
MTEAKLAEIKNRVHEQRCACYLLASTVLEFAEKMESQSAEQARPFYGLAAILSSISENLEKIIIDLEWEV